MRKELEKYGIQMPAFSKIGGILANELSVDEAARKSALCPRLSLACNLPICMILMVSNSLLRRYFKNPKRFCFGFDDDDDNSSLLTPERPAATR